MVWCTGRHGVVWLHLTGVPPELATFHYCTVIPSQSGCLCIFSSSRSSRSFSEPRLPAPLTTSRWVPRSFTDCSAVTTRGLRRPESQPGNHVPIPNMKRSSAKRNSLTLVNVVLIDDRLPHCTIVIRLSENEVGAESDRLGDWEPWFTATGNATERTNNRTKKRFERLFLANWFIETNHEIRHYLRRREGWGHDVIVCVSGVHTNHNARPHRYVLIWGVPSEVVSEKYGFEHRIRQIWLHQKIVSVWTGPDSA